MRADAIAHAAPGQRCPWARRGDGPSTHDEGIDTPSAGERRRVVDTAPLWQTIISLAWAPSVDVDPERVHGRAGSLSNRLDGDPMLIQLD